MTIALPVGSPDVAGPGPEEAPPDGGVAEPVRRRLTLVASTDRAAEGANRRASMARHPSAVQE